MPVYEYECPACEKVLEVQQRIGDKPLETCSVCGGTVKKLVSMSAFHLKGGGWYSDGYSSVGNEKKSTESKKEPSAGKEGATKESTKTTPPASQEVGAKKCKNCPAAI